ncbi:MAG: alpha/beta fold hydrolase, partial [Gaiellaceae bacterium]
MVSSSLEQDIRFVHVDGRRLAYATVGEGPLLILGRRWVSHLEADWEDPELRGVLTELGQSHQVVRYDRFGTGLSDRTA